MKKKKHTKEDYGQILELLGIYSRVDVQEFEDGIGIEPNTEECWPLRDPDNWAPDMTIEWLWKFFHNRIPAGHRVVQSCGNLICMNPTHHELEEW